MKAKFLTILLLFLAFPVSVFSNDDSSSEKLQPLRVYLDWTPNIEFAGMYAALEKGWYEKVGIDLKMVFEGLDIIPNVLKGKADIGMHSAHDLINYVEKGSTLKAFAAQYQLNPNSIVVGKNSGINSVKDLKGKVLGVFSPQEYGMFQIMLEYNGLSLSDVKFKDIKTFRESEIIDLLKSGTVDAIIAWEFNWTVTFALLGYDVRVFPGYDNGFDYYGIVFFAPEEYIQNNSNLLKRFLKVTFDGWREVYKRPEYYAKFVVDQYYPKESYINGSRDLTYKQQLLELRLRKKYFMEGVGEKYIGMMSAFRWNKSLKISKKFGLIPATSRLKAEDLFDQSIMVAIARENR